MSYAQTDAASLDNFFLPMQPAPRPIQEALLRGVTTGPVPPWQQAANVLGQQAPCANEIRRDANGMMLITCTTELPGVRPAMIDWWFGWHLTESQRYRLWHPQAHVAARAREDRSALKDDRAKYLGNVSYVDEYIGKSLKKLAIAFKPPQWFGFTPAPMDQATTICASTSDRVLGGQGGYLVHHVIKTPGGSQMRSGFWLGEISHEHAIVQHVLGPLLNTRMMRHVLVSDQMALDLIKHCGEEMNHLARFLPKLYAQETMPHIQPRTQNA